MGTSSADLVTRTPDVHALAAAAFRTGLRPDILTDTYSWGGASLVPYATRAAVMTIRGVAEGRQLEVVTDRIAAAITPLEP